MKWCKTDEILESALAKKILLLASTQCISQSGWLYKMHNACNFDGGGNFCLASLCLEELSFQSSIQARTAMCLTPQTLPSLFSVYGRYWFLSLAGGHKEHTFPVWRCICWPGKSSCSAPHIFFHWLWEPCQVIHEKHSRERCTLDKHRSWSLDDTYYPCDRRLTLQTFRQRRCLLVSGRRWKAGLFHKELLINPSALIQRWYLNGVFWIQGKAAGLMEGVCHVSSAEGGRADRLSAVWAHPRVCGQIPCHL